MAKFEVRVRRTWMDFQIVEVEAPTQTDAKRKAVREAKQNEEGFCDGRKATYRADQIEEKE